MTLASLKTLITKAYKDNGYVTKRMLYGYKTQYAIEKLFPNYGIFLRFMKKHFPHVPTRKHMSKLDDLAAAIRELA